MSQDYYWESDHVASIHYLKTDAQSQNITCLKIHRRVRYSLPYMGGFCYTYGYCSYRVHLYCSAGVILEVRLF